MAVMFHTVEAIINKSIIAAGLSLPTTKLMQKILKRVQAKQLARVFIFGFLAFVGLCAAEIRWVGTYWS